jgi:branched-chain amino acid transport system permease protein
MNALQRLDAPLERRIGRWAWPLALGGGILTIAGTLLPWTYDEGVLEDLTVVFWPAGPQVYTLVLAILGVAFLLAERGRTVAVLGRVLTGGAGPVRAAALMAAIVVWLSLVAIAGQLGGFVNVDPGGWVTGIGSLAMLVGSRALPPADVPEPGWSLPDWLQILIIAVVFGLALFATAYALERDDPWTFILFLLTVAGVAMVMQRAGALAWLAETCVRHRRVMILSAFVVAFLFPLTQGGSDANLSIATQILIFAATAMGLNIVVGLAGLLDLGYIAFLGAGAYVGALFSGSAFSAIGWHPPFPVVVLIGAAVTAALGLVIGSPTLRVSGDYLAIVTLAFGEIFRLSMNNLDGTNGPDLTNGPNGIPQIPDLVLLGFDFGEPHTIAGVTLGRFANYYVLLLVLIAFVILVFARLNNSRIGRGWVAIREDERAAEAMGVNTFGLKLLAFAGGAFLAGLAGTVKAHLDVTVSPDQFVFLESAFLVSAIVLGGMGTVAGVLLGATILKLLPEKLRFFSDNRLLIFGLLLVVMMRFRPEGLIASRRRQLEFHEDDSALAAEVEAKGVDGEVAKVAGR